MRSLLDRYLALGVLQKWSIYMRRFLRYVLFLSISLSICCFALLLLAGVQEFTDKTMALLYQCIQINLSCILLFLPLILLLRLTFTHNRKKNKRRIMTTIIWMLLIFFLLNFLEIFYTFTTYGRIVSMVERELC